MVSNNGSNWSECLSTTEYAHSILVHASTKMLPFEVDTNRVPRHPSVNPSALRSPNDFAIRFSERRQEIIKQAQESLKLAQERQKEYYDSKRSNVKFNVGELVMLLTRDLPLAHSQINV